MGPVEEGPVCVLNSTIARGPEVPVGNQGGDRRRASSLERRGQWLTRFASPGYEAIALGISSVGWCRPKAPCGQQRKGYNDRTSERCRHLVGARAVWEARSDEKLGLRRTFLSLAPWVVYAVLGAAGPRPAAVPVALPLEVDGFRI